MTKLSSFGLEKSPEKDKKKHYIHDEPDWISIGYFLLFCFIASFPIIKYLFGLKAAFQFLLLPPSFLGILVFYFLLPAKLFVFLITHSILSVYLRKIKKNTPSRTVVVIGKCEYKSPKFWFSPNYESDLLFLIKYLKLKNENFSIYKNVDVKALDEIMSNKDIRTVYLVGHGRRHSFAIDSKTLVDYCRYDNPKFKKDFVYQVHCNQGKGKSLVEYVVSKNNRKECLPEHGYVSNMTITRMFVDKIIEHKGYKGLRKYIVSIIYLSLSVLGPIILALILWIFIFLKLGGCPIIRYFLKSGAYFPIESPIWASFC